MLDLRQAAVKGKLYISEIFKAEGARDFLLEEVDVSKDKKEFLITVSFLRKEGEPQKAPKNIRIDGLSASIQALYALNNNNEKRLFKTAIIDANNGDLIKIVRDVADIAA